MDKFTWEEGDIRPADDNRRKERDKRIRRLRRLINWYESRMPLDDPLEEASYEKAKQELGDLLIEEALDDKSD